MDRFLCQPIPEHCCRSKRRRARLAELLRCTPAGTWRRLQTSRADCPEVQFLFALAETLVMMPSQRRLVTTKVEGASLHTTISLHAAISGVGAGVPDAGFFCCRWGESRRIFCVVLAIRNIRSLRSALVGMTPPWTSGYANSGICLAP
jgi:hypothetical protein